MRDSIQRGKDTYSPHLLTLLKNRIDTCHNILEELQANVAKIPLELREVHEKMISIIRSLSAANTRVKVLHSEYFLEVFTLRSYSFRMPTF